MNLSQDTLRGDFFFFSCCSHGRKEKVFAFITIIPSEKNYPGHASTSTAKPKIHVNKLLLCTWWDQLGMIYWELLKPNETIRGDVYRLQLMRVKEAMQKERPIST